MGYNAYPIWLFYNLLLSKLNMGQDEKYIECHSTIEHFIVLGMYLGPLQ